MLGFLGPRTIAVVVLAVVALAVVAPAVGCFLGHKSLVAGLGDSLVVGSD